LRRDPAGDRLGPHAEFLGSRSAARSTSCLRHPVLGDIALEFSSLVVDGRLDLAMLVYTPLASDDAARIRALAAAPAH
jgi:hypothetical protein